MTAEPGGLRRIMRNVIIFSILALAVAGFVPRLYVKDSARPAASATAAATAALEPSSGFRTATITRGSNGHFEVEGVIDGRRMDFIVDTGASRLALREREAARLGIHPAQREYTAKIATANGTVFAAPIELNRVEVGGVVVHNVPALVLPDEALSKNLLGMSFLSRVRFEHKNGRLVLEQ